MAGLKVHLVIANQAPADCHSGPSQPAKVQPCDTRVLNTDSELIGPPTCQSRGRTTTEWAEVHRDLHRRKRKWKAVTGDIILGSDFPNMSGTAFKVLAYALLLVDYNPATKKNAPKIKNREVFLTNNALKERGISESARKTAIKELVALGYFERLPSSSRYDSTKVRVLKGT